MHAKKLAVITDFDLYRTRIACGQTNVSTCATNHVALFARLSIVSNELTSRALKLMSRHLAHPDRQPLHRRRERRDHSEIPLAGSLDGRTFAWRRLDQDLKFCCCRNSHEDEPSVRRRQTQKAHLCEHRVVPEVYASYGNLLSLRV